MINTIIALLVEAKLLKADEAEELAVKIRQGTLPQDYASSYKQVHKWLEEIRTHK